MLDFFASWWCPLPPQNIFFGATGDVKLGDFGLAKFNAALPEEGGGLPEVLSPGGHAAAGAAAPGGHLASASGEASGVLGTSYYISPEIADGWASYDEKVGGGGRVVGQAPVAHTLCRGRAGQAAIAVGAGQGRQCRTAGSRRVWLLQQRRASPGSRQGCC